MIDLHKSSNNDRQATPPEPQGDTMPITEKLHVSDTDFANNLHASLDFYAVMQAFVKEVRAVLNCDGIEYTDPGNSLYYVDGSLSRHRCAYEILFGEQLLGNISFTREEKFIESELLSIENMVAGLALPLRNSIKYQKVMRYVQEREIIGLGNDGDEIITDDNTPVSQKIYIKLLDELVNSRRETEALKAQLHESRNKMLSDALTGLPNRAAYDERIALEASRIKRNKMPLCLAVWDIDYFKKVNDTYGHDVGDQVLKHFSRIVRTRLRRVDMFARIGGEEFVLLMPDTPIKKALEINNRLRIILESSVFHNKGELLPVTASVGIADFEEDDVAEVVLKKADIALYKSKKAGRNRCTVFLPHGTDKRDLSREKQHKNRRI